MPWETHDGRPRPWRTDRRLSVTFEPGFPDDVSVLFLNPDSANGKKHEVMWVRIIAYDARSDRFLGYLLNRPDLLSTVAVGDNVAFAVDTVRKMLVAVSVDGRYDAAGWPSRAPSDFESRLRAGIRAYRGVADSSERANMNRCVSILTPAMNEIPAHTDAGDQLVAHYVLGRCLAEEYRTQIALAQFRAAIAADSTDADSHMALLAELSVMAHQPPGSMTPAEEARRDSVFVAELAVVRARFIAYDGVREALDLIFDPALESRVSQEQRGSLARLQQIGYATLRWKQR